MIKSKIKIGVASCVFAVLLAATCISINVVNAEAAASSLPTISDTVTKGKPGDMTVENEIKTALMPVGHCLYIFGGAWNSNGAPDMKVFADEGAGEEAMTIGVPQVWDNFYKTKDGTYDCWADEYMFMRDDWSTVERPDVIHWGADCSGYIGWVLQNTINKECGFGTKEGSIGTKPGWVTYAEWIGFALNHLDYGSRIPNENAAAADDNDDPYPSKTVAVKSNDKYSYVPGNIYTFGNKNEFQENENHCWLCLGQCSDGSVLLLHCSDPGVFICGTSPDYNEDDPLACDSEALKISRTYMKRYYTDFYNKFGGPGRLGKIDPVSKKASGYLKYSEFNWNTSGDNALTDDAGLRNMKPQEIMDYIYCEDEATATLNYSGQTPVIHFNDALVEPSAVANSQIVYNRDSVSDTAVDVSFAIPAGYKFDSIKINDVDYSASLITNSNTAKVNVPISDNYKIECASLEVVIAPQNKTAETGDWTGIAVVACVLLVIVSGALITKKELL